MKELIVEDSFYAAAFLVQGLNVIPFPKKEDKRVAFRIEGDIPAAIEKIEANMQIGVLDYIRAVKRLRTALFILKGSEPRDKRNNSGDKS